MNLEMVKGGAEKVVYHLTHTVLDEKLLQKRLRYFDRRVTIDLPENVSSLAVMTWVTGMGSGSGTQKQ